MDTRINNIFFQEMKGDKSFQERESPLSLLFGRTRYSQEDMRETWHRGVRHGIEIGLRKAGLDGQAIELDQNTTDAKHKEFLEKFYALSKEYNCAVQYHPEAGMVVITR